MMRLNVYYQLDRGDDGKLVWKDERIEEIIGHKSCGSGTFVGTGERDLEFRLSEIQAQAAKAKLAQHGYRFDVKEVN